MDSAQTLLEEVLEAHGGRARWAGIATLEAQVSASGFLFTAKRRPVLDHLWVEADAHRPHFVFRDHPHPGERAEWLGDEAVRIHDREGRVRASREHPREAFRGLRRELWWDELDLIYFAGYATWGYLTTPFLLQSPGVALERLGDSREGWVRLAATFPRDLPTHCRRQVFCFDDARRLRRLDYTAEVVGGWARAAHLCMDHRDFDGLLQVPTRRRVVPRGPGGLTLPGPTLVAIEVHALRAVPR